MNDDPIAAGLRDMIKTATENGGRVGDELIPYKSLIVEAFDAGGSAQKIADFLASQLSRPISKDRVLRFAHKHGAKRTKRPLPGDLAAPSPQSSVKPTRGSRGRGGGGGTPPAPPNPANPAPAGAEPEVAAPPAQPAGSVQRINRTRTP